MARGNVNLYVEPDDLAYLAALIEADDEAGSPVLDGFPDVDSSLLASQVEDAREQLDG